MIFESFHCLYYAGIIPTMPRAGGDYVWQTRLLGPLIGFMSVFPGWLLCLPMWITLNTVAYCQQLIAPLFYMLGYVSAGNFILTGAGLFTITVFTLVYSFITCGFGMKWYARIQKPAFIVAGIGLLLAILIFWVGNPTTLAANYNSFFQNVLGYSTPTAYQDVLKTAVNNGFPASDLSLNWNVSSAFPLLPLLVFYGMWPVWGAPMYGEVRGASSVKNAIVSTMMANVPLNIAFILVLTGLWKSVTYPFYEAMNYGWWMAKGPAALMSPSVPMMTYFVLGPTTLSVVITAFILVGNTWAWIHTNGAGNGYLLVSRGMFAMSFDRMLPSTFAKLSTKYRIPLVSFIWTAVIAAVFSYLYSFNIGNFAVAFLDATFTLVIVFVLTAICVIILPYIKPKLWESSAASKYTKLFQVSAVIFIIYAAIICYYWIVDPLYGVNSTVSAIFLAILYVVGAIVYISFKYYRKQQGIDVSKIFQEIPSE